MKKLTLILLPVFCFINISGGFAQQVFMDSIAGLDHHHTPLDILSGSGDDSIVCYKQVHRNIYLLVTGLIIIIAIVAIRLLRVNKRNNRLLKEQNALIEEKNKSITDSINYAKRLQNAILPSPETVNGILPEHFILYQPKDIVSGDFYWVSGHDGQFIVAAIDCTGHGVPGALLSIVGHNAINQTINELNITQPDQVLISMNTIVKKVLKQDTKTGISDGMDMALCRFDKTTNMLNYAGANNPVYVLSDGKLSVIKASKLSIGSMQEEVTAAPVNHSIQLKKGDCFYIFSDGYADQFGGKENKKFKSSRMQELLLSINDKPMSEQQHLFNQAFNNWKGGNEQVDDILIIGIRV